MPSTQDAPLRLPPSFRKKRGSVSERRFVTEQLRRGGLHTVCEEARCPNIGECFAAKTATFMILGDTCTRACHFCAVKTGRPLAPSAAEPEALAEAAACLELEHVVITSVDRDELPDLGAKHWAACIRAVKKRLPGATVEVLTPDFKGHEDLIDVVLAAEPDVFNHNIESVARLYKALRPQSSYDTTRGLLRYVAQSGHGAVKSGLMVGLGETDQEVLETLDDLKALDVDIVTIGQYLRPTLKHWAISRYVEEQSYERFRQRGAKLGFTHLFAGPYVRSSYHAAEAKRAHEKARRGKLVVI